MPLPRKARDRRSVPPTFFVEVTGQVANPGFYDEACFQFYLARLASRLRYYQVALHAFLLLREHVWLLLTAPSPATIDRLIVGVDSTYCEYFNGRFRRSTSPRTNRRHYRCLPCQESVRIGQKYIEREPLRQGLVSHPGQWTWSSYCRNAFGGNTEFLTPHSAFISSRGERVLHSCVYREFIAAPFSSTDLAILHSTVTTAQQKGSGSVQCPGIN